MAEIAALSGVGRPVTFVGLDGGDWNLLDRYVGAGLMPNLAALVREGAGGTLLSLHPPLSPLVWTTMMTGESPVEHGILDFTRRDPATGREGPITSDERRVPAVWNMATYAGKRVAVFGLWATYPAETVNGLLVSDRLFPFLFTEETDAPGIVHPAREAPRLRALRRRLDEATGLTALREYLPWLDETQYRGLGSPSNPYAHPVTALRRILVETRLAHEVATDWIRRERPDLAIVYFQGTDSIGHVFAPFAPPRQPQISDVDYERYHRVSERYFRFVDGLLGEYKRLAEARGAVLVLASDHGFRWGEGRPTQASSIDHATAAAWHRPEGIFLLWGAGIQPRAGHPLTGKVNQVAATLLAFLDLPPRAPGDAPLAGVDAMRRTPVDYSAYYHPASPVPSAAGGKASEEALEKLRALGYVGVSPGRTPSTGGTPGSTRTAGSYANESLILRLEGRPAEAMAAAESALRLDPDQANALWALSDLTQGEAATRDRSDDLLVHAVASGLADGPRYLAARADQYRRAGQGSRAVRLLDAAVAARRSDPQVWRLRGRQRVDQGACVAARDDFQRALSLGPDDRASLASLGLALLCLGDEAGAREALGKSAASLGEAHRVLAQGALARGDVARAEREARAAMGERESEAAATLLLAEIDLRRDQPREALRRLDAIRSQVRLPGVKPLANLEFLRGEALARMDRTAEAEAAFREEIRLFPESIPAYQRLALVLALQDRGRDEVRGLLEAMYEASPRRETASLAARTLQTIGDKEGAIAWQKRMVVPGGRR